ncbi:MAG: hypothetical protein HQL13_01310 [Candidatus Omnitrophica bacterium]|nr:hypothetical protein [Candidatus Omnitrophota bacterium]
MFTVVFMPDWKKHFKNKPYIAVWAFFIALLIIGLAIFKDYGVHADEYNNQKFGRRWTDYVSMVVKARSLSVPLCKFPAGHDLIHGPAFEIFLTSLTDAFLLKDTRKILFIRHLAVFLLFYIGVVFFYFLCLKHFQSWQLALLGCVFLVLSPRIFADAFYNSVDIPLLAFFIIATFTMLQMLEEKTALSTALHALTCSILVNIRLIGFLLPVLTVIFIRLQIKHTLDTRHKMAILKTLIGWAVLFGGLTFLFNPLLWSDPLLNFFNLIENTANFNKPDSFANWAYAPVWITVSTPLLYSAFFLYGLVVVTKSFAQRTVLSFSAKQNSILFLICFSLPLIISTGRIYNGWRHIYFIYPFFIILAIMGLQDAWQNSSRTLRMVIVAALSLSLGCTALFMVKNHPYQNLYFNRLAGTNASQITQRFALDYWGLSFRKGLEYILKTDKSPIIPVSFGLNVFGINNIAILPPEDKKRLVLTDKGQATYFLTNNEEKETFYCAGHEYYSIRLDGMKVLTICKK